MFSNQQIASVLGGKVHGKGVLAPAPGRAADDLSLSIAPNAAGDAYVVTPAEHYDYVHQAMEAARKRTEQCNETRRIRISNGLPAMALEETVMMPRGQVTWFPSNDTVAPAPEINSASIQQETVAGIPGTKAPETIEQKIDRCVAEIISTKLDSVREIASLLLLNLPKPREKSPNLRPYVTVYKRLIAIDLNHVAKDMLGGTPTLSPLEVDALARKVMRAPQNHRAAHLVAGHLATPDKFLVLARMEEIKEGRDKHAAVVPFELKELS